MFLDIRPARRLKRLLPHLADAKAALALQIALIHHALLLEFFNDLTTLGNARAATDGRRDDATEIQSRIRSRELPSTLITKHEL